MKNNNYTYKILAHCKLPQIRFGFDASVSALPCDVRVNYVDLSCDGIMSHLKANPDLIVVLLSEGDSEFGLPLKLKLFAPNIPLLLVLPAVPKRYYHAMRVVGVDSVVELPIENDKLCDEIVKLLKISDKH